CTPRNIQSTPCFFVKGGRSSCLSCVEHVDSILKREFHDFLRSEHGLSMSYYITYQDHDHDKPLTLHGSPTTDLPKTGMNVHPPKEKTGTRRPLGPKRLKGMFLGSKVGGVDILQRTLGKEAE
ncbi:hypothetical protein HHX47_DHR5000467, partial [Lentinula edodes]